MDFVQTQTYLGDILHNVSQALLAPDVILLLAFIAYALWCIGSVLVELFAERRDFKQASPALLSNLMNCDTSYVVETVMESGLLNRQKIALLTVYDYRSLPGDALMALTRKLVAREEAHYSRIIGRNEMGVKAAPMLGLMGTLIPLGPGIAALGTGDLESLSRSIIVAFDTTVAGLATAVVCMAVVKVRRNWYEDYMTEFDATMATMLQRIREMRAAGEITANVPSDYAAVYADALKRASKASVAEARQVADASLGQTAFSNASHTGPGASESQGASDSSSGDNGSVDETAGLTLSPASDYAPSTDPSQIRAGETGKTRAQEDSPAPETAPERP